MYHQLLSEISGVSLLHVSADHDAGTGTITAADADSLTWTAPGSGTAGDAVAVANGTEVLLYDGEDDSLFVLVGRTSSDDLSGTASVYIFDAKNTADRLAEVDDAISQCLAAQAAGHGDSSVTRASLATLYRIRNDLEAKLARENGTSARHARADMRGHF